MTTDSFDVVREVLDHELIDSDGMPCGMVDEVLLDGEPGKPLLVVALLVGPGAWAPRLPGWLEAMAVRVFGRKRVRVPWSAVARLNERIELSVPGSKLGLGVVDRRLGRWLARLPGGAYAPD
jgi:sporulation protein YlmC with PRC-barrel domain